MGIPDLVGLKLDEALNILKKSGFYATPIIVRYFPPSSRGLNQHGNHEERVIRQRAVGEEQIELIVSSFRNRPLDFESCKPTHEEEG
nr:MAG: hypothetical protein DIU64_13660 [Caldicoprobacter oshimai]